MSNEHDILLQELVKLLEGGGAHATLKDALDGIPADKRGVKPHNLPYSIWQLAEHIRIAQWDMLEFSKDGSHQSPNWPDDYWPKEAEPADDAAWNKTVEQINTDRAAFIELLKSGDIYTKIPHGSGQSILREALQIADHNAYHTAEIVLLRRLLGIWK
ncbi:DinB family protein [Mucilaginibacter pallidiroseus]|uniref:DinB family protein n=1 Tax=Mucilaginibacter pallidiroseus TaxID=2599295 RepID=A0A563U834_9SPHI|nr:DinB family protein [Mucilaginibacter pallidiroseus]TWR27488.1 DinB family protein [Mucilaginibacter pallidiroseus]